MRDDLISIELGLPGVKVLDWKVERWWIEVLGEYRTQDRWLTDLGRLPRDANLQRSR